MSWKSIEYRLVVESGGTLYYPRVLSVSGGDDFPYQVPVYQVDIETNTNASTTGYTSPIRTDDVLRLQVNETYRVNEKPKWIDMFEGRVLKISTRLKNGNRTSLMCRGHAQEILYRKVESDYSASSARTGTILAAIVSTYLDRLTNGSPSLIDTTSSTVLTSYNVDARTKYVYDVVKELESLEGYAYRFSVVPQYTATGHYSGCYVSWQPAPTTATPTMKIIENRARLDDAEFSSSIEGLVNDLVVTGATGISGSATDAVSQGKYGVRQRDESDPTIATNYLCEQLAESTVDRYSSDIVSGKLSLIGNNLLRPGDLLPVKLPSLEINGASIDDDYRVYRISHNISAAGWKTDVVVGEAVSDVAGYIATLFKMARYSNFAIKTLV